MANLLNNIIANQPKINTMRQNGVSSFNADTNGKVKPLKDKAKLLPSRIFGSPIEYAKDLKKDIAVIGKATKGKANDHELGRINDLAMKIGSLGLAAYLCVKNPLKLSKAMEFVGFGTFFASMAIWPKLAIQAPLKLRTGVDIHQKYIDSQGRKKMLHQDPQYDLTDLYTRKDLDRMGKKLGVSENLPDRDNFIKQRAKKTAVQGNTLWMLTAGFATPIMSALASSGAERFVKDGIEKFDIKHTKAGLDNLTEELADEATSSFERYLSKNSHKNLSEEIPKLLNKIQGKNRDKIMSPAIIEELQNMATTTIEGSIPQDALSKLSPKLKFKTADQKKHLFSDAVKRLNSEQLRQVGESLKKSPQKAATEIVEIIERNEGEFVDRKSVIENIKKSFSSQLSKSQTVENTLGDKKERLVELYKNYKPFQKQYNVMDKFKNVRMGENGDSYLANHYQSTAKKFIDSLNFKFFDFSSGKLKINFNNVKDMKKVINGDTDIISQRITELVSDEKRYKEAVDKISKEIGDFQNHVSNPSKEMLNGKMRNLFGNAKNKMEEAGFHEIAKRLGSDFSTNGTLGANKQGEITKRIMDYEFPAYRVLTTLETFEKIKDGTVKKELKDKLRLEDKDPRIDKLTDIIKKIMLDSKITDHVEKLKNRGYNIDAEEYKAIMEIIYSGDSKININTNSVKEGLNRYRENFLNIIGDYAADTTPALHRTVVDKKVLELKNVKKLNGKERASYVSEYVNNYVKEAVNKKYNTSKWLTIFGASFAVLTLATLIIGTQLGKKTKIEKQIEEEGKVNG